VAYLKSLILIPAALAATLLSACNGSGDGTGPGGEKGTFVYAGLVSEENLQLRVDTTYEDVCVAGKIDLGAWQKNGSDLNSTTAINPKPAPTDSAIYAQLDGRCAQISGPRDSLRLVRKTVRTTRPSNACNSVSSNDYDHTYRFESEAAYAYSSTSSSISSSCQGIPYTYSISTVITPIRKIPVAVIEDAVPVPKVFVAIATPKLAEGSNVDVEYSGPEDTANGMWRVVTAGNFESDVASGTVRLWVKDSAALEEVPSWDRRAFCMPGDKLRVTVTNE